MRLRDKVCTVSPRERAGSRSSDRSAYQKNWAISQLLRLHESGAEYLITFDFQDDVLVFDSASDPDAVHFYQVKTKQGKPWRLSDLIYREKGANGKLPSHLGNLYDHQIRFGTHAKSLTFVSNSFFDVQVSEGEHDTSGLSLTDIPCTRLCASARQQIRRALKEEHQLPDEPEFEPLTFLNVAELSLEDHRGHTIGKLHTFLDGLRPGGAFRTPRIYAVLFDDIERRNDYAKEILSFDDLVSEKSISRAEFQRMLDEVCAVRDPDQAWRHIDSDLGTAGVNPRDRQAIKRAWTRYEVDRLNPGNAQLRALRDRIEATVEDVLEGENPPDVWAMLDGVVRSVRAGTGTHNLFDDDYLRAVALAVFHE